MRSPISALVVFTLLSSSILAPAGAQTRPVPSDPPVTTRPAPSVPPQTRPTPSVPPQTRPWPGRPETKPTPLPGRPGVRPPANPGYGGGYARTLRCESRKYKYRRCNADTDNRVRLIRRLGGTCTLGRSWGYDRRSIWVDNGCRAEFAYGRRGGGSGYPDYDYGYDYDDDDGPSAGAIIAGVAVAGGLIALLANAGKKKQAEPAQSSTPQPQPSTPTTPTAPAPPPSSAPASFPPRPPAVVTADLSPLPSAARPSIQTCLNETARQVGATGGSRISYDRLVSLEQGNGGWRFGAALTATYPDGPRSMSIYCRATPSQVIQLDFTGS